jgi:hypothetical protein
MAIMGRMALTALLADQAPTEEMAAMAHMEATGAMDDRVIQLSRIVIHFCWFLLFISINICQEKLTFLFYSSY